MRHGTTTNSARAFLVIAVIALAGCASTPEISTIPTTTAPVARTVAEPTTSVVASTTPSPAVTAFNGRVVPDAPRTVDDAVALFIETQRGILTDGLTPLEYADFGHQEQLVVRTLGRNPDWQPQFLAALPELVRPAAELHLYARAELGLLHSGFSPSGTLPAWRIIEPEPVDVLVGHYQSAEAASGIEWEVLAGINLIETGMGRIDGLSVAGAQGPMQFLPTTWDEVSEGGDIDDPADAIPGAARYLVRRGGDEDIRAGLWGYNNSDHYVNAVLAYRDLLQLEPKQIRGFYNWEIYVGSTAGTLWLPVGFSTDGSQLSSSYLDENPWALTLPSR